MHYALLVIDSYSKRPEVFSTTSIAAEFTMRVLWQLFSRDCVHPVPVTENGTPFNARVLCLIKGYWLQTLSYSFWRPVPIDSENIEKYCQFPSVQYFMNLMHALITFYFGIPILVIPLHIKTPSKLLNIDLRSNLLFTICRSGISSQ